MEDVPQKRKKVLGVSRALIVRTVILLIVCGIAAFVLLAAKLYDIQITDSGKYETSALTAQLRKSRIIASRGTIFDVNGKILAMSAAAENVFISPFEIDRDDQDVSLIANGLSAILDVDSDTIVEMAAKTWSEYEVVKYKVENEEARLVRKLISEYELKGIHLEHASKRYYPNNRLASQIIGYVRNDNTGIEGLEYYYNKYLTGVNGRQITLRNAKGEDLRFTEYEDYYDAQNGDNITLTLDTRIHNYVERHLERAIVDYDVQNGGMCIVMNAKTGEILAMASYPNYDPNDFMKISDSEIEKLSHIEDEQEYTQAYNDARYLQWRNRAIADTYEPGSVFKILTLAMSLEENIATPGSTFYCSGSMEVRGRNNTDHEPIPLHCWHRNGHGQQTLNKAIQNSCNLVCVDLALSLGAEKFYKYIDAFGLFDKTGFENSAEGKSLWWDRKVFFDRNNHSQLASASFGQTFTVTPIQMITAATAAINGGYLMQPYIVKQITDGDGNIIKANEPTVVRQVISSETSEAVRKILTDVVETGTGKNARIRGYTIGGKTGTSENVAQIATRKENAPKDYIVSFFGFAPADDPEIVILLLLDTPSHDTGIYISGGSMAAPVVGSMLTDILPLYLGLTPKYSEEELKDINVRMPRVIGKNVDEASTILSNLGFDVSVIGEGSVIREQLPAPNAYIASGLNVKIYTESEQSHEDVTVPQLSGMSYNDAKHALENRGMFIRTTGAPRSDSRVIVSIQSIPADQEVAYGSVIEVTLIDKDIVERRE